jgi:hypothetical protein
MRDRNAACVDWVCVCEGKRAQHVAAVHLVMYCGVTGAVASARPRSVGADSVAAGPPVAAAQHASLAQFPAPRR